MDVDVEGVHVDGMLRLLEIFGRHLSILSNQIAVEGSAVEPTAVTKAKQFIAQNQDNALCLATVAKSVIANPIAPRFIGWRDHAADLFLKPPRIAIEIDGLDTGPPKCLSFAESVLQESMLSHAPPVS